MTPTKKGKCIMFVLNRLNIVAVRNAVKAIALTAICIVAMVATVYAAPVIIAASLAALAAVFAFVAAVVAVITHAAVYAVSMLLGAAVRVVIFAALALVVPVLWRLARWPWAHREGVAVLAKGLALGCLVVGVFVTACVWGPVLVAALPTVGTVAGVFGGFVAAGKVI